MDQLSSVFSRFPPTAKVFYAGAGCRQVTFDKQPGVGHIHILRAGSLTLSLDADHHTTIDEPSMMFYPRPCTHHIEDDSNQVSELVCASVEWGMPESSPISYALPSQLIIPLHRLPTLEPLLEVLFHEAFSENNGRQIALDNLVSYFLIMIFRYLITENYFDVGVFAGLSDARLAKTLNAIHQHPEKTWTVESLADKAGMSRARFAMHFHKTVGTTPMDYLGSWRMSLVQSLLKRGKSVKQIAPLVGYQNAAAMTRAFNKKMALTPSEWLVRNRTTSTTFSLPELNNYVPHFDKK